MYIIIYLQSSSFVYHRIDCIARISMSTTTNRSHCESRSQPVHVAARVFIHNFVRNALRFTHNILDTRSAKYNTQATLLQNYYLHSPPLPDFLKNWLIALPCRGCSYNLPLWIRPNIFQFSLWEEGGTCIQCAHGYAYIGRDIGWPCLTS